MANSGTVGASEIVGAELDGDGVGSGLTDGCAVAVVTERYVFMLE